MTENSDAHQRKGLKSLFSSILPRKNGSQPEFSRQSFENLDSTRQEMVKGVFELSMKNARDIMIPRVDIVAIDSDIELKPLVKLLTDEGHSRLPVYEEKIDNIVGILYAKDLLKLLLERSNKKFQLKKILHDAFFVPETMPLDELLLEFKRRKLHLAIVVDEYGGIGGICTMEDILEEIVGEITDEFDDDKLPEIEKTGRNSFTVDSRMPITDFNEAMDADIPTEDFDTIGGYVVDLFGKIPNQDDSVQSGTFTFKIKDISGTVINRIGVTVSRSKE